MGKVSIEDIKLIMALMQYWKGSLSTGGKSLVEVQNPERNLLRRFVFTIVICKIKEAIESHARYFHRSQQIY